MSLLPVAPFLLLTLKPDMLKSILWRAIEGSAGPKILGDTNTVKGELYEDPDNDSNNGVGVTVYGVRPDGATTADAGTNEGNADNCADEKEEDTRAGAGQTSGKT
jgi:hypothetical protein